MNMWLEWFNGYFIIFIAVIKEGIDYECKGLKSLLRKCKGKCVIKVEENAFECVWQVESWKRWKLEGFSLVNLKIFSSSHLEVWINTLKKYKLWKYYFVY